MDREILFRGKDIVSGEWIAGFLVDAKHIGDWVEANPVRPETVGQFIGLTDKNGKKIFEGDILSEHGSLFSVVYDVKWARFKLQYIGRCIQYPEWNRGIQMEIVGNIHDNPELLEGGVDNG